jgi:hypothetical protein
MTFPPPPLPPIVIIILYFLLLSRFVFAAVTLALHFRGRLSRIAEMPATDICIWYQLISSKSADIIKAVNQRQLQLLQLHRTESTILLFLHQLLHRPEKHQFSFNYRTAAVVLLKCLLMYLQRGVLFRTVIVTNNFTNKKSCSKIVLLKTKLMRLQNI